MALLVDIETDSGVIATYWRVVAVSLDWLNKVGSVTLVGYLSEKTRRDGKTPLGAHQLPISGDAFNAFELDALNHANPIRVAYDHALTFYPVPGSGQINPFSRAVSSENERRT